MGCNSSHTTMGITFVEKEHRPRTVFCNVITVRNRRILDSQFATMSRVAPLNFRIYDRFSYVRFATRGHHNLIFFSLLKLFNKTDGGTRC